MGDLFDTDACQARDLGRRALLQAKLATLGVECEDMCKRIGRYPQCECPGFEGQPADDFDTRKCMAKYCQDPSTPCPTDAFVACVKETTKVSVLQWSALFQRLDNGLGLFGRTLAAVGARNVTH